MSACKPLPRRTELKLTKSGEDDGRFEIGDLTFSSQAEGTGPPGSFCQLGQHDLRCGHLEVRSIPCLLNPVCMFLLAIA